MVLPVKDLKILQELGNNARQSHASIGKKVGLSKQLVRYRINGLVEKKVIDKYLTVLDTQRLGYSFYDVAFQLKHSPDQQEADFISYMKNMKEVHWIASTTGKWNVLVAFLVKDVKEFHYCLRLLESQYSSIIDDRSVFIVVDAMHCSYKYLFSQGKHSSLGYNKPIELQHNDVKILQQLGHDPLMSYSDMAKNAQLSYDTVKNRYKAMEQESVIIGCKAKLNPLSYGYEWHVVFLQLKAPTQPFFSYLKQQDPVVYFVNIVGEWDMMLDFHVKNQLELQKVLKIIQTEFPGIIKTYEPLMISTEQKCSYIPGGIMEEKFK